MGGIEVLASGGSYPVEIGAGSSARLDSMTRRAAGRNKLFLFYDANFFALHGRQLRKAIHIESRRVREMVIPAGEKSKSLTTLASIYDFLLDHGIARSDFILACGGGVTTDLVGYAAATTLRGIPWGAAPTTLLGMVDASLGGKTGINHDRGKNLIGAFWAPKFVCADVNYLATLESRHMVAGLGEILKCAGLAGSKHVAALERFLDQDNLYYLRALTPLIRRSAQLKTHIVSRDEREHGPRMCMNLGHTFGHGIEKALGFGRLLHGEAVILGLWAALTLGEAEGFGSKGLMRYRDLVERHIRLLPRRKLDAEQIFRALSLDKKRGADGLRFVLLERLGKPIIYDNVERRSIKAALKSMIKIYRALGGKNA
ncbi:MAG: 3-dehydroquinate synthase [bacterium]|nr:3-dehydroquinate synthase [bacterium]